MIIIAAVDNSYGMMFNHRRQSTDRVLRKKILEIVRADAGRTGDSATDAFTLSSCAASSHELHDNLDFSGESWRSNKSAQYQSRTLWMDAYSARQFKEGLPENVRVDEDFLDMAEKGDYCFVEDRPVEPYAEKIESICLFKWNRDYPSDCRLDYLPEEHDFYMTASQEFPGYSHQKITLEVWTKLSGQKAGQE